MHLYMMNHKTMGGPELQSNQKVSLQAFQSFSVFALTVFFPYSDYSL